MTTVGDAVKSAIDTNWNVGTGGVEPVLYNSEDVGQGWPPDNDWVMILGWEYDRKRKRRNDTYISESYTIDMRVHSKNDANGEERLDEIVTEIYRIVTPTNVTGFHTVDIIYETRRASDKRTNRFIADLTVELVIKSADSAIIPGSTTTSTHTVDELTVNTSIAGSPTAALGATTITGNLIANQNLSQLRIGVSDVQSHLLLDFPSISTQVPRLRLFRNTNTSAIAALQICDASGTDTTAHNFGSDGVATHAGVVTLDSAGDNITSTNVADLLMFGSANAAWVTPSYVSNNTESAIGNYGSRITCGVVGTHYLLFWLGLPTTKGALKLYVSGHRVGIFDADATDFVTSITVEGQIYTTRTILNTENTNRTAPGLHTTTFTPVDCSTYNNVTASLVIVVAVDGELGISTFQLQCYYAA